MIEKYGTEILKFSVKSNTNIKNGVIKKRRCTDFIAFVSIYSFMIFLLLNLLIYIGNQENVSEWVRDINNSGQTCGIKDLSLYPYVYYL